MSDKVEIRGLTLWQPWAEAVASGKKTIENRPWAPPRELVRQRAYLAIHAGKTYDAAGEEFLARHGLIYTRAAVRYSAILGIARLAGVVTRSDDPMFFGPFGWVLEDVAPIDPIPCRGLQGLWPLSPELLAAVRERRQALGEGIGPSGRQSTFDF
jgi:hypothetical protein